MSLDEFSGPDLAGVVADAKAVGLDYVVIGGFSVDPDRSDLRNLEAIHGPLPIEPIPGVDS
jgi:hypothetical protein